MIRLRGVGRTFEGVPAIRNVGLRVDRGEHLALIGPSGAGKTTLLRLLNLSLRPTSGTYELDGRDTSQLRGRELRSARSGIATIHQLHDGVGRLGVLRNILAGRLGRWSWWEGTQAWIHPRRPDIEQAHAVAVRVGLGNKLLRRFDRLSGGEQQRVAIARAIFQDALIILADEPVASLDPVRSEEILELLVQSAREDGRTLIVNLHQPELAHRFFPRIVGLRDGEVAFDLPSPEVDERRLAGLFADASEPRFAAPAQDPVADDRDRAESIVSRPARRPTNVG